VSAAFEALESRALMSADNPGFVPPFVLNLIAAAYHGENTAPAAIQTYESALQSQLTNGPLADLKAGAITSDVFAAEVAGFVSTYQAAADLQFLPRFPNVDNIIKMQGTKVGSLVDALLAQETAGLIDDATFQTMAEAVIKGLTGGPLYALHTPVSSYVTATRMLENSLTTLSSSLAPDATNPLTVDQVQTVATAEITSYQNAVAASLSSSHPFIYQQVASAVTALQSAIDNLATATDPQTALNDAITAFDNAVYDTTGIFGPFGPLGALRRKH
jgi:hypothetical protein